MIPTITGEPDYDAMDQMVQTLYGNAALLTTTLWGGANGYIRNIMTPPLYATLTATPYEIPMDPSARPVAQFSPNWASFYSHGSHFFTLIPCVRILQTTTLYQ
jgi:hypothetical protein